MRAKILLIVEGEKEEIRILGKKYGKNTHGLLKLIDSDYEIVPFCNPIYELYEAFINGEYDGIKKHLISFRIISKNT